MTEAVGWRGGVLETGRGWKPGAGREGQTIALTNPAPTVTTMTTRQWRVKVPPVIILPAVEELMILQGFPPVQVLRQHPRAGATGGQRRAARRRPGSRSLL